MKDDPKTVESQVDEIKRSTLIFRHLTEADAHGASS